RAESLSSAPNPGWRTVPPPLAGASSTPAPASLDGTLWHQRSADVVGNARPMPIYQLPAHPAVEEQEQHRDQGNPEAGRVTRSRRAEAQEQVDQRQHHGPEIADHMVPGHSLLTDAPFVEEIREPRDGGEQRHHDGA